HIQLRDSSLFAPLDRFFDSVFIAQMVADILGAEQGGEAMDLRFTLSEAPKVRCGSRLRSARRQPRQGKPNTDKDRQKQEAPTGSHRPGGLLGCAPVLVRQNVHFELKLPAADDLLVGDPGAVEF